MDNLQEKLDAILYGLDVSEAAEILEREYGASFVDEKITDGDEESGYEKMRSFTVCNLYVRLYYSDSKMTINYVEYL